MRTKILAALLTVLCLPAGAAYGYAEPLPVGRGCMLGYVSNGTTHDGVVYSDPVTAASLPDDDPDANPATIEVECVVFVDRDFGHGAREHVLTATGSGTGVAVVEPEQFSVAQQDDWDIVGACTIAHVTDAYGTTRTYYQSDDNNMWQTTPYPCSGTSCAAFNEYCAYYLALLRWAEERLLNGG